jgi:hypothetical protein
VDDRKRSTTVRTECAYSPSRILCVLSPSSKFSGACARAPLNTIPPPPPHFLPPHSSKTPPRAQFFDKAYDFIQGAIGGEEGDGGEEGGEGGERCGGGVGATRTATKNAVLVHCAGGVSRCVWYLVYRV